MELKFVVDEIEEIFSTDDSSIMKDIGLYLSKINRPGYVDVYSEIGDARFQLIKRGGGFFIREEFNEIIDDNTYPSVYLVMVDPEYNNYKFYQLEDLGDEILATYGRIGATATDRFKPKTYKYPKHMYWVKLMEKLAKGYKDFTDIYLDSEETNDSDNSQKNDDVSKDEIDTNTASYKLYNMLKRYSKHVIEETFISAKITPAMVEKTDDLLNDLYIFTNYDDYIPEDVDAFNEKLLEILKVSPRRVDQVKFLLASTADDFPRIIRREESLLMAMQGVVENNSKTSSEAQKSVSDFGSIKVHYATEKQSQEVMRHLSDTLKPKVKNIYRVIHPEHKKRFNQYLKDNNVKKVKQLWHGSRNENWLSIINQGLLLRPNAVITGKMFGNGIYFAPSSVKSWGYTSGYGSYWARGNQPTSFMGLYAVAFGNPLNVTGPGHYDQDILNRQGCNCVYAHAGNFLRNDEIIFYNESAMLLNYIVEFEE